MVETIETSEAPVKTKPTRTAPKVGDFNANHAADILADYSDVAGVVDALSKVTDPEAAYKLAVAVRSRLAWAIEHGAGVTLPKTDGFGSDNFSSIASALLGLRQSTGKVRSLARQVGKRVRGGK
jgi:hypothetical protein